MLGLKLTRSLIRGGGDRVETRMKSSIADLQAAFRDTNSPFHIPPGSRGPATPEEVPQNSTLVDQHNQFEELRKAREVMLQKGFDPHSFWEQKVVWGDLDSFQHVNNVKYVQFFESSRIKWLMSLGEELGGPQKAQDMIKGKGISFVLKSIAVQFRRPVTFPDTLLIGFKPEISTTDDPTLLPVTAGAYSLIQQAFVAYSNEMVVWYSHDEHRKCDPGDRIRDIVRSRVKTS
ncbi:hypothetical protein AX15_000811 [Amanita polypyramis BW_CC]|nr:hypothetical protein AX15_000811 [Amanita polypyramis BW_CC]